MKRIYKYIISSVFVLLGFILLLNLASCKKEEKPSYNENQDISDLYGSYFFSEPHWIGKYNDKYRANTTPEQDLSKYDLCYFINIVSDGEDITVLYNGKEESGTNFIINEYVDRFSIIKDTDSLKDVHYKLDAYSIKEHPEYDLKKGQYSVRKIEDIDGLKKISTGNENVKVVAVRSFRWCLERQYDIDENPDNYYSSKIFDFGHDNVFYVTVKAMEDSKGTLEIGRPYEDIDLSNDEIIINIPKGFNMYRLVWNNRNNTHYEYGFAKNIKITGNAKVSELIEFKNDNLYIPSKINYSGFSSIYQDSTNDILELAHDNRRAFYFFTNGGGNETDKIVISEPIEVENGTEIELKKNELVYYKYRNSEPGEYEMYYNVVGSTEKINFDLYRPDIDMPCDWYLYLGLGNYYFSFNPESDEKIKINAIKYSSGSYGGKYYTIDDGSSETVVMSEKVQLVKLVHLKPYKLEIGKPYYIKLNCNGEINPSNYKYTMSYYSNYKRIKLDDFDINKPFIVNSDTFPSKSLSHLFELTVEDESGREVGDSLRLIFIDTLDIKK